MSSIKNYLSECHNIKYWDYDKNKVLGLDPKKLGMSSVKHAWWVCDNNHSYFKPIRGQASNHRCPVCESLAYKYPELKEFWGDNEKPFESFTSRSKERVNWVCDKGHKYSQVISSKTIQNLGCPYCSGRYASPDNNLWTSRPDLTEYWSVNNSGAMEEYLAGSKEEVLWVCPTHGEYLQEIRNRVKSHTMCPYCSGHRVNTLTSLGGTMPELVDEWSPKNSVSIYDVSVNSGYRAKWVCSNHGEYEQRVYAKSRGDQCPMCSGRQAHKGDNLAKDYPELKSRWVEELNGSMGSYKPSSNKVVAWRCKHHDVYYKSISKVTDRLGGCPKCSIRVTTPNRIIARRYKDLGAKLEEGLTIADKKYFVDVYLPEKRTVIEFDSYYYHKNKLKKDIYKTKKLLNAGYKVIRIREHGLHKQNHLVGNNNLQLIYTDSVLKEYHRASTKKEIEKFITKLDNLLLYDEPLHLEELISEVRAIG